MQEVEIRDVWSHNLEEELEYIRNLVKDYPMVAMVRPFLIYKFHLDVDPIISFWLTLFYYV